MVSSIIVNTCLGRQAPRFLVFKMPLFARALYAIYRPSVKCVRNDRVSCIQPASERACLITLHSNFEIFQKGHPAVEVMLDRRIFER